MHWQASRVGLCKAAAAAAGLAAGVAAELHRLPVLRRLHGGLHDRPSAPGGYRGSLDGPMGPLGFA